MFFLCVGGFGLRDDAAEFTHQIVMVSLFRNVAFRVTTIFQYDPQSFSQVVGGWAAVF